jgi:hypothetical protein
MGTESTSLLTVLPALLWFVFAVIALFLFRNDLHALLSNVIWRVRAGAPLKIASFELGASYVSPTAEDISTKGGLIETRVDEQGIRHEEREAYYEPNRGIFLVHKLAPSKKPNQLYDILIYLVPHRDATLACVQKVEYYFGRHWGKRIFASIDRSSGFSIATSAFGPFVCTAELHFTDGSTTTIWRYIDFEMGAIGKE